MADIRKVRRCLFGRPTDSEQDSFKELVAGENLKSAAKFELDWNYDVVTDKPVAGAIDWCPGAADIPSVYMKGYVHKCRQRSAMLPVDSVQNSNQCYFGSSDDSSSQDSVYTADVLIGSRVQETTPKLEERTRPLVPPPSSVSTISTKSFGCKRRQKQQTQRRLLDCDQWSVRKNKRSRSLTPETESSSKRQRLDS